MMAAPEGNKFWKNRSKHGRDKIFATPALLWDAACQYFEWCENNPWYKNEVLKSGSTAGTIISIPTTRPYTYSGLCLYLSCSESYFRVARKRAGEANDIELLAVLNAINNVIYTQQFEGATLGIFNTNIIARSLGMKESNEQTIENETDSNIKINIVIGNSPQLALSENEIID